MITIKRSTIVLLGLTLGFVAFSVMAAGDIGGLQTDSTSTLKGFYEWLVALAPYVGGIALAIGLLFMKWTGPGPIVWILLGVAGVAAIPLLIRGVGMTLA